MSVISMARRLLDTAGKFQRDDRGNIAVIFAVALIPLLGFVGAAIDYSRAVAARTKMQAALDSTALMAAKDAPTLSASALTTRATGYFNALFTTPLGNPQFTFAYTPASGGTAATVKVSASGTVQTDFLKMVGHPSLAIGTSSTTTWSNTRMRVALALDNTGSMAQNNKMTAMQAAAKELVASLSASASTDGDVYISVVPFAKDVNVGTANSGASWIDWTDYGTCSGTKTTFTTTSEPMYTTQSSCQNASIQGASKTWTAGNKNSWSGCVTDRTQPYDVQNTAPTSTATDFPAENDGSCPQALLPMTFNWSAVNTEISNMSPNGGTNQPIGLFWAWWTLQTVAPFAAPAKDPNFQYVDAIILLTDGLNTQDRWPANGDGATQFDGSTKSPGITPTQRAGTAVDAREKLLCDAIKANGTVLYTIQVNTDGEAVSTVLPYCASSPDKFFILTSSNQISATFASISGSLQKLRVSK
jgi:Flp pilus assembly protein TadG